MEIKYLSGNAGECLSPVEEVENMEGFSGVTLRARARTHGDLCWQKSSKSSTSSTPQSKGSVVAGPRTVRSVGNDQGEPADLSEVRLLKALKLRGGAALESELYRVLGPWRGITRIALLSLERSGDIAVRAGARGRWVALVSPSKAEEARR